jgi:electron-transferring-flavoprotein dehydrogenase
MTDRRYDWVVSERETLDLDILIVGGGAAGLSAALRLAQLQKENGGDPLTIGVLDKAREPGAHALSGAILDPSALKDLIPDFVAQGAPLAAPCGHDDVYFFTERGQFKFPITPPPLRNHGNYIISLNRFVKWLGQLVEAAGVDIFPGFAAQEILYAEDGKTVIGVRTGDRGLDKQGQPKANFEPGVDVHAKVTIVCDGVRGNLTKTLVAKHALDHGKLPQLYALGIKELWEVPAGRMAAGSVIHTMGYPLRMEEFGGAFIYAMPDNTLSVGFVSGLDYLDPMFDPHQNFLRFKQHPFVATLLAGGKLVRYGAKALPEGGWHTVPRPYLDGAMIAGDAAGFMNSMRLKGIHLAMRTGMLAAETAFDAVRAGDVTAARLSAYERAIAASDVKRELYPVRNVHQAFEHGLVAGVLYAGLAIATRGWWVSDPMPAKAGFSRTRTLDEYYNGKPPSPDQPVNPVKIDRQLTFDKATDVHLSGTRHREDEPVHLIVHNTDICRTKCRVEYGNPCTRFCPANVYEMVDDGQGGKKLHINASNCVHCKTCDIMDPYQIIDWVPPEGGEGPQYDGM